MTHLPRTLITNFNLDTLNGTAEMRIVGANGTTFFKFTAPAQFTLEARPTAQAPGDIVATLIIDIMRWFLLVLEEIGFDDQFGTQSGATTEQNRFIDGDIEFER